MAVFEDITVEWRGRDYVIPGDQVLGAIARVEDVITFREIHDYTQARQTLPMAKIAMAFGAILRYAGASVNDDEVYEALFDGSNAGQVATNSVTTLMTMMLPPKSRQNGAASGNPQPPAPKAGGKKQGKSKKPSSSPAARESKADGD